MPTLPLFVHERLSTSAILDTLKGHKRDQQDDFLSALYGSPERSLSDQVLRAYEYRDNWVNRLILGDPLVVMNSLLRFESLGGQVQMIYMDPPYGVTATFDYYQINATRAPRSFGVPALAGKASDNSQSAGTSHAPPPKGGTPNDLPNSLADGFVYKRRQNQKGEEVGGIVPHITLKSIANHEPPAEEVLVDRPEVLRSVVRVTGPFSFEATIPTAEGFHESAAADVSPRTSAERSAPTHVGGYEDHAAFLARMLEVLRRAPVLRLPGNQTVTLKNIRLPAKTLALSAEAMVDSVRAPALTPALSPGEREKVSPVSDKSKRSDSTQTRGAIPPLPAGEGRGEGERSELNETPGSASSQKHRACQRRL